MPHTDHSSTGSDRLLTLLSAQSRFTGELPLRVGTASPGDVKAAVEIAVVSRRSPVEATALIPFHSLLALPALDSRLRI